MTITHQPRRARGHTPLPLTPALLAALAGASAAAPALADAFGEAFNCSATINLISNGDVFQSSKKPVTMPCDSDVAIGSRHRRANNSSNSPVQRQIVGSFKDGDPDFHLGNLEHSQREARGIQQTAFVSLNAFRRPETEIDTPTGFGWF